jgi:glycosyltransferase involved in cell wall biosynthesis
MKRVAVILTTYNAAPFLQRTLDSVFRQEGRGSLFEIELIVVDDYSTDETQDILRRNGIEFLLPPAKAGGPNPGRNIALRRATGDCICIMDHDDEWQPHRLAAQIPLLDRAPIVTCGQTIIDTAAGKTFLRSNTPPPGASFRLYPPNATFLNRLTKAPGGQQSYLGGILYSSELRHIEFETHFGMVDLDWVLQLFHKRASAEVCESLYNRYVDGENLSLRENFIIRDFYYSLMTIETYAAAYPQAVRTAYKRIHGSRARYHYVTGDMPRARFFFLRSGLNWKTVLYFLTTYGGAEWVKQRFNVFG